MTTDPHTAPDADASLQQGVEGGPGLREVAILHAMRNVDHIDCEHLIRDMPDSGHGKFWKAVARDLIDALATPAEPLKLNVLRSRPALQPRAAAAIEPAWTVSVEAMAKRLAYDLGLHVNETREQITSGLTGLPPGPMRDEVLAALLRRLKPDARPGAMDVEALRRAVAELDDGIPRFLGPDDVRNVGLSFSRPEAKALREAARTVLDGAGNGGERG